MPTITPPDGAQKKPIRLLIDGESVEVLPDVVVGWRDILAAESDSMVEGITEPVFPGGPEFHFAILSNLRAEIQGKRQEGKDDRTIYRELMMRYHPDLYQGEDPKIVQLAEQYAAALNAMKQATGRPA